MKEFFFPIENAPTIARANKAIKPALVVAETFLALIAGADSTDGGGNEGGGEDERGEQRADPLRGPLEQDNLPFHEDDLFNPFNGADPNLAPNFVREVTHSTLGGDANFGLTRRANALSLGFSSWTGCAPDSLRYSRRFFRTVLAYLFS